MMAGSARESCTFCSVLPHNKFQNGLLIQHLSNNMKGITIDKVDNVLYIRFHKIESEYYCISSNMAIGSSE